MRMRYLWLAIALASLTALGVIGVRSRGSTPALHRVAVTPAPAAEPTAPPREAANVTEAPATPVTGCGKPSPCPNRDCKDCPHNVYLK